MILAVYDEVLEQRSEFRNVLKLILFLSFQCFEVVWPDCMDNGSSFGKGSIVVLTTPFCKGFVQSAGEVNFGRIKGIPGAGGGDVMKSTLKIKAAETAGNVSINLSGFREKNQISCTRASGRSYQEPFVPSPPVVQCIP